MTQLRIRRKPAPFQRPTLTLVPMALILAAGIASTIYLDSGQVVPSEAIEEAAPRAAGTWTWAQMVYVRRQTLLVDGKAWVLADHPPVTNFRPAELQPAGNVSGWNVVVNTYRGLPGLSVKPRGFDRLYLDLGQGRYAPLRWRDVP